MIPFVFLFVFFQLYENIQLTPEERAQKPGALKAADHTAGGTKACIEFSTPSIAVLENEKKVRIGIKRFGKMDCKAKVR